MPDYRVALHWEHNSPDFDYETCDRSHRLHTGSGIEIPASAAPEFMGANDRLNPEEALVGAVSSCHLLTFLAIAARRKWSVASYTDAAVGSLEKNAEGRLAITRITLHPIVVFSGTPPDAAELAKLHEAAHRNCFIANSIRSEVVVAS